VNTRQFGFLKRKKKGKKRREKVTRRDKVGETPKILRKK
jgi:hypothetical protein